MRNRCIRWVSGVLAGCLLVWSLGVSAQVRRVYEGVISQVYAGADGACNNAFGFVIAGQMPIDPGSSAFFFLDPNAPRYNELVSVVLLAKATGGRVQVTTVGFSSACGGPIVGYVFLVS